MITPLILMLVFAAVGWTGAAVLLKQRDKLFEENEKLLNNNNKLTQYVLEAQKDDMLLLPEDEELKVEKPKESNSYKEKFFDIIRNRPIIKTSRDKDGCAVFYFDERLKLVARDWDKEYLVYVDGESLWRFYDDVADITEIIRKKAYEYMISILNKGEVKQESFDFCVEQER